MIKKKTRATNDGVLAVYRVDNAAEAGNAPIEKLVVKHPLLRFERRMVGVSRHWQAWQFGVNIDLLLRIQAVDISTQDVAIIDGLQYTITQLQRPPEIHPPVIDLSLTRLEKNYEVRE